jgi:prophage regulatory protein
MTDTIYLQRREEVLKRWPVSKSTLYTYIKECKFVPPVSISYRSVAWISSEVDALIVAMVAGKNDDELKALVSDLVAQRQQSGMEWMK